jgi:hypothetical protein
VANIRPPALDKVGGQTHTVAPVLLAIGVFYLIGGVLSLRSLDAASPSPRTWGLLTDQLLFGWKDLLTTLPPVSGSGPLLVLPFALGLATGSVGMAVARLDLRPRWLRATAPLLVPGALLCLVLLLGLQRPQSLWVQGALFAAIGLAWLVVRGQRRTVAASRGAGALGRMLTGALLIGLAALVALPVGSWALGSDDDRTTLRAQVQPPFDIGEYPSPLSAFRRYVKVPTKPPPENLYERPLFTISGVPAGTRVRFATLDRYDGVVWGAANNTIPGATDDTYRRVSSTIDNPAEGEPVTATVTIDEGYDGVWLPVAGALQTLDFEVGETAAKSETFRFNLATSTAVVPSGLRVGDRYQFTAILPDDSLAIDDAPSSQVGEAGTAAQFLETQSQEWTLGESDPLRRVFAAAQHLKAEGKYSDGVVQAEKVYYAGHHVRRLGDDFVNAPIMAGNDEQYAATMALLANRIGVPARVVMGAVVPESGAVMGSDVSAWVELQLADGTWRTLPTEEFMGRERPAKLPPEDDRDLTGVNVPPPVPVPPPSVLGEQTESELTARNRRDPAEDPATAPAVPEWVRTLLVAVTGPLLAAALLMAAVVVAKLGRRRRRRYAGRASARIAGAWRELVDHARDLGQAVPVSVVTTRREQSLRLDSEAAPGLARRADAYVFGPDAPPVEAAEDYWSDVDEERRAMSASASRWRRLTAAVSLRTLRWGGPPTRRTPD